MPYGRFDRARQLLETFGDFQVLWYCNGQFSEGGEERFAQKIN
jgi:hypothetical protein